MSGRDVYIIGAAHTRFGEHWDKSYRELLTDAGMAAIQDARMSGEDIDEVFVGSMSTGTLLGQEHIAPLLLDGAGLADLHVPATRVEAAAASGAVAVRQAVQTIRAGTAKRVVVGGIEKMSDVSEADQAAMASSGIDNEWEAFFGATEPALHAIIAKRHMAEYGTTREQLAHVAVKNHAHGTGNPLAQFQRAISLDMVLGANIVADPLGVFDFAPQSDGAACLVLSSEPPTDTNVPAVRISGSGQGSDTLRIGDRKSLTTWNATDAAARMAYHEAGVSPADIQLAEVYDISTISELLAVEDLGLLPRGKSGALTASGRTTFGGDVVVNPSGGLKARGHPAGATGIAQLVEVTAQLRGVAHGRQVENARIGIAHDAGGTGATAVVHVLEVVSS
jgi:acetyl-CoA C-acetyltransferase